MRLLALSDVLAISGPERQRLREADEAIRDVLSLVEAQAAEQKLDAELISKAMIDLLLLAAARLALATQPRASVSRLPDAFAELAQEALDWATIRKQPDPARDLH
jgi:hypothetical protein